MGFATATTWTFQQEVAAGESTQQTVEMGGDCTPGTEDPLSATVEPPMSTTDGAGGSGSASKGALDKDDADFVNLLTAPHASHEVRNEIVYHTIGQR